MPPESVRAAFDRNLSRGQLPQGALKMMNNPAAAATARDFYDTCTFLAMLPTRKIVELKENE
jgi:hypothetical protein